MISNKCGYLHRNSFPSVLCVYAPKNRKIRSVHLFYFSLGSEFDELYPDVLVQLFDREIKKSCRDPS